MAVVDLRDETNVFQKGSSLLAAGLTAAQGAEAFPVGHPAAVGGWIVIGHLEGGSIQRSRDIDEVKDEADTLVVQVTTRNELVVNNTVFETDAALLNFLDWLEDNTVLGRYPLPTPALTSTPNQWWFFYAMTNRKIDWEVPTANDVRKRGFEFLVTEDGTNPLYAVVELPDDQSDTAWDSYASFKDAALP